MIKIVFVILCLLFSSIKNEEDSCDYFQFNSCAALAESHPDIEEYSVPEEFDDYAFQTPPRYDALGNYLPTYQDMRYLVGYAQLEYNRKHNLCSVTFITRVNPDLGTEGVDYYILYTFGDEDEQEDNVYQVNSRDDSYPNGLSLSCRIINKKTSNEVASLTLPLVYFLWDNVEIDLPDEFYKNGQRGSIVELFGWSLEDIGEECEFLGIAGYMGVKVFSPNEHLLTDENVEGSTLNPWWYGTQIVSYKYTGRVGNQKQLKKIINRCRSYNVRVYTEVVINHMTQEGNDINLDHRTGGTPPCDHPGAKAGSGFSPMFQTVFQYQNNYYTGKRPGNEYPAVPFFPSDFHCYKKLQSLDDPFDSVYGSLFGLQDLNTEKEYVQKRIATFFVDMISMGVSGVEIANGRHIQTSSFAKIFSYTKEFLGGKFPEDIFFIIIIEGITIDVAFCEEEGLLDFGVSFTEQLKDEAFTDSDINQIKFWFKGNLAYSSVIKKYLPLCDDEPVVNSERWTVSLEYSDDINKAHNDYNIYIKTKDKADHKQTLITDLFLHPKYDYSIRFVFSSFSIGSQAGIPDGKSEKSYCSTEECVALTVDVPFKRAFNPHSVGYDCGSGENDWVEPEYSRVHRDIDVINAMRAWTFNTTTGTLPDPITKEELYSRDLAKAECDPKCLICNEESKRVDKCIFCDSNNDYFPVMEIGGAEEYYQCYKKTAKVERLYFSNRDKAFLPCYENCRYCDEAGDANDNKCTACDYNLMKKPGTKDNAKSFNCVISCAYSYYYTESGQFKCTNTPVCPEDRPIYIEEKKKCIASCKDEAPTIYLYDGKCVEVCPSNTAADTKNYICKEKEVGECTLGVKSETISSLYSISMINSFVKAYSDEYFYNEKRVTKISNNNYNIYIYRDASCPDELGLGIPNVNPSSEKRNLARTIVIDDDDEEDEITKKEDLLGYCYKKVQEYLKTENNLIVVFFEDTSKVFVEKGYLLYNPENGAQIDFVTICNQTTMVEKDNITVADETTKFKYIYIKPPVQTSEDGEEGPTSCEEGYAPLYKNQKIDYSNCRLINQTYDGVFYDSTTKMFLPCYLNCKSCVIEGTRLENNCMACAAGYIKNPSDGRSVNFNCVTECIYSYYFNPEGEYTCTSGPTCPLSYKIYIPEKKQCIDACKKDDRYYYTYNGNCVEKCPDEMVPDDNYICIDENVDKCTWSSKPTSLKNFEDSGGLDSLVSSYHEEFYYTTKHVSEFNSEEYNITIYIESDCLLELKLNFPFIDFGDCYQKVQNESGIDTDLIVVLLKKLDIKTGRTSSSYSLYNPKNGIKLDAATICKDEEIVVEENVLDILEESGVDYESIVFLTDQNIDVFDSSGAFYTDLCYEFDSPVNRDITLEDRLETFYPNISLCDPGCQSKGVNLTTMKAICSCSFSDISSAGLVSDIQYLNEIFEIISSSNIMVLKCVKYMFKRFSSSVGGYLMIFCIIIVAICGLVFYFRDLEKMKKYIINKTSAYINYLNENAPEEDKRTNIIINSIDEKEKSNDSNVSDSKDSESKSNDSKVKNQHKQNSKIHFKDQKDYSIDQKGDILKLNKINNSKDVLNNNNQESHNKLKSIVKDVDIFKGHSESSQKEDFKLYLAPSVDDQEFEDIILEDKRSFQEVFCDALNDKQLLVNTFSVEDNFRPFSLKFVLLILTFIMYFVINGLFYGDDAVSEIYHIEGEDTFFGFFPRSITRYIYSAVVGVIIGIVIDLFFVDEKKMKGIFNREKKNIVNLKIEITKLTKGITIRYIAFVIFVIILFILLMFYLLCFNYVYPHTQGEWVKSSIFLIIIMQILEVAVAFLSAGLRFVGFALKSEKIFRFSKFFD